MDARYDATDSCSGRINARTDETVVGLRWNSTRDPMRSAPELLILFGVKGALALKRGFRHVRAAQLRRVP